MSNPTKIIKKIISKDNHWKVDLLSSWQEITRLSASQIRIEAILDKTLVLGVAHPAVAHQLSMSSQALMAKLKKIVPNCKVERLAFRTVDFQSETENQQESASDAQDGEQQLSITSTLATGGQEVYLNKKELQSLDSVCCERLKKLLRKFYARCKRKEAFNAQALPKSPTTSISGITSFDLFSYG